MTKWTYTENNMSMNYYALFLNGESYIEKCLALIKHVGSPYSRSLPHITLRLFKGSDDKLSYIQDKKITYLNIIEPGAFNISKNINTDPYVIYLKCESEELEEIDYRPDFPFSRLHITLYEGTDLEFANNLLHELGKYSWHFRLEFDIPKSLTEQKIGTKNTAKYNYTSVYKDILGETEFADSLTTASNEQRLQIIKIILDNLYDYLQRHQSATSTVESLYTKQPPQRDSKNYVDDLGSRYYFSNGKLAIDNIPNKIKNKPEKDNVYVTPPEYARDMAECAIDAFGDDSKKILFGDSAIGTGALFIAIKRTVDTINIEKKKNYTFESAIGIDIDEVMAKEAFLRYNKRDLKVIYGDAISPRIDNNLGKKRNMMIVNPPYNRHEEIPAEYRKQIMLLAKKQTGIRVPADAGLFVYHLLIMDKWLDEKGVAVWLLPSIVLQARYGLAVRKYLTENVKLTRLHIYNEEKQQFKNVLVSTMIVVFKKESPQNTDKVIVSFGDSISYPSLPKTLTIKDLKEGIKNWRNTIVYADTNKNQDTSITDAIKFSSLFDIKRGIATGANSFFVMDREKAQHNRIPEIALKPVLPKARYLKSQIVCARDDGYPDIEQQLVLIDCDLSETEIRKKHRSFYNYLEQAKEPDKNGKAIIDRNLIKSRNPWYKQEKREPPLYLMTYMGRKKETLPSLYFILNKSKAVALNTYILLYPKQWLAELLEKDNNLCEKLLIALNYSSEKEIDQQTRVYSGGLQKLEPNELKELLVYQLPDIIIKTYKAHKNTD